MGLYNEIIAPCPNCGTCVTFQTKSGSCILATYSIDNLPPDEFGGIVGDSVECTCGTVVSIHDPNTPQNEDFSMYVRGGRK